MRYGSFNDRETRHAFEQTSRTLIDYTLHQDAGRGGERFTALLNGIQTQAPIEALLPGIFGITMDRLNAALKEHTTELIHMSGQATFPRGQCPLSFEVPEDRRADLGEHPAQPVPGAEMKALLEGVKRLPDREQGWQEWYPESVIAAAEKTAAAQ